MTFLGPVYFYFCSALILLGGIATIASRNPIRGVMGLLVTIVSMAGMFLALHAQFLAAVQLIVYAGAIVVLFIFVIMLLGENMVAPLSTRGMVVRSLSGGAFTVIVLGTLVVLMTRPGLPDRGMALPVVNERFGGIDDVGRALFTRSVVPFELSSALLIIAAIGAIAIARGKPMRKKKGDAQP